MTNQQRLEAMFGSNVEIYIEANTRLGDCVVPWSLRDTIGTLNEKSLRVKRSYPLVAFSVKPGLALLESMQTRSGFDMRRFLLEQPLPETVTLSAIIRFAGWDWAWMDYHEAGHTVRREAKIYRKLDWPKTKQWKVVSVRAIKEKP